ncbi:MAG TPA: HNH endonuclease signature motif containing protein, partial [Pseudonocardiaceae bacterium]|nr:HNH endonuclease signature motif containing protein [Pseudonocardiaceae bacterium]
ALSEGQLPTESGERPQDVLTINLPVLQDRIGTAQPALGGPINTDTTRRLARDARIIPIVLGSRGEPLDVARTVPTAIRRDAGCAFPGSSGPARWRDIHHIIHWDDNGPTSLNNCVALCSRHHRLLHHSHWQIHMVSGIPQFHPPPWLDGPPRTNPSTPPPT